MPPQSHQLDSLRLYGALVGIRKDWGGGLILCCGQACVSSGTPAAVSIAGGATLAVDCDAAAVKSAMRLGEIDFVVNTLDEALRTLKNEIRQRRPLSVGLIGNIDAVLGEMVERGVLPDLLLIGPNQFAQQILQNTSIRALQAEGMPVREVIQPADDEPAKSPLSLVPNRQDEVYRPAASAAELRTVDQSLLAILPPDDLVRRRWVQRVAQYLPDARTGGRWIWLTEAEQKQVDA